MKNEQEPSDTQVWWDWNKHRVIGIGAGALIGLFFGLGKNPVVLLFGLVVGSIMGYIGSGFFN
jgi:hypothetical protein